LLHPVPEALAVELFGVARAFRTVTSHQIKEAVVKRTASDRWNIAFLASLTTCGLLVVSAVAFGWWVVSRPVAPAGKAEQTVYARNDFTPEVMGKTEEEVQQFLGHPDSTSSDSDALYWHYKKRTRDPASKDVDTDVQLVFRQGKVAAVNY
jgi:hypothetical protein